MYMVAPHTISQIVLEPYEYMASKPGKEFRVKMIDAFNDWLHVPQDQLRVVERIVTMLHSASLL